MRASLLIDTATEEGIVALFEEGKLIQNLSIEMGFQTKAGIMPLLDQLFKNRETKELSYIAVGIGPGSYTGLRVGAIVAKTLAWVKQIPLVSVSTLLGFALETKEPFAALLDAKMGGVYMLTPTTTLPFLCPMTQVEEKLSGIKVLVSPHVKKLEPKFLAAFPQNEWQWQEGRINPALLGEIAWKKFLANEVLHPFDLELLYLTSI